MNQSAFLILLLVLIIPNAYIANYTTNFWSVDSVNHHVFVDDDPNSCIATSATCDLNRNCSSFIYSDDCLISNIKLFTTLSRITCCFKCCIEHTLSAYKLRLNLRGNLVSSSNHSEYDQTKGSILMSISNVAKISSIIYTEKDTIGSPAIYRIATLLSEKSLKRLTGRNIVFISYLSSCVNIGKFQNTLSPVAQYGNTRVTSWYSNQFPCTSDTIKQLLYHHPLPELISNGVRSPALLSELLLSNEHFNYNLTQSLNLTIQQLWSMRPIILNCGCLSPEDMYSNHQTRSLLNFFPSCQNTIQYFVPNSVQTSFYLNETSFPYQTSTPSQLYKLYSSFLSSKFILITSNMQSLSYCEWEALATGSIPIFNRQLLGYNKPLKYLLKNTPKLWIDSYEQITQSFLEHYEENLFKNYHKYNIERVYFPYWLHKLLSGLLGGSFLRRPWSGTLNTMKTRLQNTTCNKIQNYSDPVIQRQYESKMKSKVLNEYINSKYKLNTPMINNQKDSRKDAKDSNNNNASRSRLLAIKKPPRNIKKNITSSMQYNLLQTQSQSQSQIVTNTFIPKLEIIIPRCCEKLLELEWILSLLQLFPKLSLSIYYKCSYCLPKSKVVLWLPLITNNTIHRKKINEKIGVRIIEDSFFLPFQDRVQQIPKFDSLLNGKEASAYLYHIVLRYPQLATHTIFLHTDPASHLHFESFMRMMLWLTLCDHLQVDFLALNAIYLYSKEWGGCCGPEGSCKTALYQYLNQSSDIPGNVGAYKGGQFLVSKSRILSHPLSFWQALLDAIDGNVDLPGCALYEHWDRGPQIGSQLERLWHIFFGQPVRMPTRTTDTSLPNYLRTKDCSGFGKCSGAV